MLKNWESERDRLETIYPGKVMGCQTDVTKQESVAAMIRSAAQFGAGEIHFLFNNAGAGLTNLLTQPPTQIGSSLSM